MSSWRGGKHPERRRREVERRQQDVEADEPSGDSGERGERELVFRYAEYSGPIPPPELIAGYQEAIPNGGERVLALAEREQEHRHRLESVSLEKATAAHRLGQLLAFVLSTLIVVAGAILIANGDSVAGYGTLLVGAAALLRAAFQRRGANGQ
jgi:uncharacterized membrane protein